MRQSENPNEVQDFIAGLKIVIRNAWPTQEEFSKGVTSKVNMSNILRGTGGTSYSMRQALAKKAGMTVEEIIALGKQRNQPAGKPNHFNSTLSEPSKRPVTLPTQVEPVVENHVGKSASELFQLSDEITNDLTAAAQTYSKSMASMLRATINERDKLLHLLAQEQAIMNTIQIAVKAVDPTMKVGYTNRAMMEQFQVTPGENHSEGAVGFTNEDLEQVFMKGDVMRKMVLHTDDTWYVTVAYPVRDASWNVSRVCILTSPSEPWFSIFKSMGWTPPAGLEV